MIRATREGAAARTASGGATHPSRRRRPLASHHLRRSRSPDERRARPSPYARGSTTSAAAADRCRVLSTEKVRDEADDRSLDRRRSPMRALPGTHSRRSSCRWRARRARRSSPPSALRSYGHNRCEMREGLAREFPEAVRAAAWTRGRIARPLELRGEQVLWATISAIGVGFLVSTVAQALAGLTVDLLQLLKNPLPLFTFAPLVTIVGISAAVAVALRVGGPVAFALYLGYIALGLALGIPGLMTFCERSGGRLGFPDLSQCTLTGYLASLW